MAVQSCVLHIDLIHDLSSGAGGKYGRLFPDLPGLVCDENDLLALGRAGAAIDALADDAANDNPRIAAGHTMFGHMIAHDLTADRSLLKHHASMRAIHNFRTPRLDFESLYDAGPSGAPYMYDMEDPDKFLLGATENGNAIDVLRNPQGKAIIGDPRNDVHGIISQLHLTMLKLHNRIVDHLRTEGVAPSEAFSQAQRNLRWHLQWVALHEYLPLTVGEPLMRDILSDGPRYFRPRSSQPFIPVEFADAAFRFGHSQVRLKYRLNASASAPIFPDLAGGQPIPTARAVDWKYFLPLDGAVLPQLTKRIGPHLPHTLIDLPEAIVGPAPRQEYHSLACRDLLRARALNLPSGETIARHIGAEPLSSEEAGLADFGWKSETPLWYYILKEAEVRHAGEHLGPVGGRIVAETLVGLIDADPTSFRSADPSWTPTLPSRKSRTFTLSDAVALATSPHAVQTASA
ncbi:MAG: peroxidase [Candidatus Eremiobacteraeota bacterium]|nr:peroxidase [Candidatus Eremiobacteraeota bacterium]